MKLRTIAIFLAAALASAAAHAQSGVYLSMDAQQFDQIGVRAIPLPHSQNTDRPWLFGPGFGVYYDVTHLGKHDLKTGPIVLGIDGRGDILRLPAYGSQYDREDGILSLRIATKSTTYFHSTPYLIAGLGIGHTRIPSRTYYNNNLIYVAGIGFDRKLHRTIDWRMIEVAASTLGGYQVGYAAQQNNFQITVSTGVVFRFH